MSKHGQTDRSLIRRLNRGDESAFDALFMRLHHKVFLYSLNLIQSKEVAEEIMQDVFITVWKKREKIDPQLSIDALLFKITKDLCFNYLKKLSRENNFKTALKQRLASSANSHTENQVIYNDYYRVASHAIDQLPTQRRKIFKMNRMMGMSYEEIADRLSISKNTVKVQLVKASKFIREYFMAHTDTSFLLVLSLLSQL